MARADLHEAVARAIAEAMYATEAEEQVEVREAAAVVIRVVLAEVEHSIEALGTDWTHVRDGVTSYEPAKAADFKREALAVLAGLVPPPLV